MRRRRQRVTTTCFLVGFDRAGPGRVGSCGQHQPGRDPPGAPLPCQATSPQLSAGGRSCIPRFLQSLWELSRFGAWPAGEVVFVDEFDLPPRTDDERGGAPDYTVLWDDRLWVIELKTEAASHRQGQIFSYFELARHHHPDRLLEVTYLTPPLSVDPTPQVLAGRFAHLMSGDVPAETVRATAVRRLGGSAPHAGDVPGCRRPVSPHGV